MHLHFTNTSRSYPLLFILFFVLNIASAQTADFTINNSSQCLTANNFVFTNTSSNTATAYQWNFGDGSTSTATNPSKTYSSYGNYSVQLIATIGGINYYTNKTVAVNAQPQCSFTYYAATGTGNSYSFQSTSSIGSGSMNYSWDFGDGATATSSNPSHTYLANGTYAVTLTVTSDKGCICSTVQPVIVTVSSGGYSPNLSFTINNNSQCLAANNFSFNNTTIGISGATYRWTFGDGSIATLANPTHSYTNAGTYIVTLIATISGIDYYYSQSITVTQTPTATITGNTCVGSTLTATTSTTNIAAIQWNNGASILQTSIPTWSSSPTVVAGGNGAPSFTYPITIGASSTQLYSPRGIYLYGNKNLYITDNSMSRLQKWAAGATSGTSVATSIQITGVGVDALGNIYVVDDVNNRVQKWAPGATVGVTVAGGNGAGNAANQLSDPRGNLIIATNGDIYINDTYNHRIQKWAVGATSGVTVAGGNGQGNAANQLNNPTGFFVDAAGAIYVTDSRNYRIQKWAVGATSGVTVAGGNGRGTATNQLYNPFSVYVDASGSIYVDDIDLSGNHRIQLWTAGAAAGTTILNVIGSYPDYSISTVFVDVTTGDIYVTEDANSRVVKYTVTNTISNSYVTSTAGSYTATITSFGGCTATSNTVVVAGAIVTPTIEISTGASCSNATICAGSSITFNASITNSGSLPTIQWKVNGSNVATGTSFTATSFSNNDIVTAVLTSNATCATLNSVTSNSITIATKALPTVTIANSACVGTALNISGTGISGSTITWLVGGVPLGMATPSIDTNAITVAGGLLSGSGASQLNNQQGIFVDVNSNLYIADFGNDRVQKWTNGASSGITIAGGNGQGLASNQTNGYGLFVDKNDNLYTVESLHRVQKWAPNATNSVTVAGTGFSGNSATQFTLPKSVYVDDCGNMYVADTYNHRVQKFSNGSTIGVTVAGTGASGNSASQLSYPTHVQVDASGNIYVADNGNDRIQKFAAGNLTATTVAGTGVAGNTNNKLNSAWGMFIDGGGNVYVADTYNNRIMYWANGATTGVKIAGTGNYGNGTNGLNYPTHVFVDASGNVYVSDSHNNRVQKFSAITPVSITPSTAGTYTAMVSNIYGCSVTSNTAVVTNCATPASPSFTTNVTSQCITGNNFVFTNTSTAPSGTTYAWDFGDGATSTITSPTHSYSTSGYFNVQMIATNNGLNYYANSTSVYVGAKPIASFAQYYNSPLTYTFNSTSSISSGSISSYVWNFGDGTSATTSNPQHTFASANTYNVKLIVTSDAGCVDSIITAVIIGNTSGGGGTGNTTVNPSFTINLTNQCITGNSFVFNNTSTAPNGTTYLWNFGDNTSSTIASPTHIYATAGYFNVQMIATYNGQSYYANSQSIYVGAKPVAAFNTITGTGSGNAHTFISTSTITNGSMSYAWDFGDGATSTQVSPQHIYTIAGTVNVKLVVTSDLGCKDSITQAIVICPTLNNQAFNINAASSCFVGNYFGVQNYFGNNAGYPMTYLWNYGDGATSTLQNPPYHNYAAVGNYSITLTTTLTYPGCAVKTGTYSVPVTVHPMPVAAFNVSGSPTTMCFTTNNYTFNNTSTIASGNANYVWDFGDTTNSNLYSPSHSYNHAGSPNLNSDNGKIFIKLVATSNNNCKDSVTDFIKLYNLPIASTLIISSVAGSPGFPLSRNNSPYYPVHSRNAYDTIQCFGGYNWFSNTVTGTFTSPGDYWKVNFDDASSGTGGFLGHGNPYNMYTSSGNHPVSANIISSNGCLSNTVYGKVILTPNTDTLPHAAIGLYNRITNNVGYDTYKLFFASLSTTACRPIINSEWSLVMVGGNSTYNHGTLIVNNYAYNAPLTTDSAWVGFDVDPLDLPTVQVRLITTNDLGMKDTAYATFGASNSGYTNYRLPTTVAAIVNANRNIGVYPNPSSNEVNIAVKLEKNYHTQLAVYNALGQKVLATKQFLFGNITEEIKLNIKALNSGNYYVQITDDKNNILANTKFIKAN